MRISIGAGLALAILLAGQASAGVVLSDNFNGETPPPDQLNWTGDATFTVGTPPGSVDLIGEGGGFDFLPGNGGYIDLDGSSGSGHVPAGELISRATFGPGNYTLTFDLAGNHRDAPGQTTTVSLGGISYIIAPLGSDVGFTKETFTFHTTTAGHLTISGDGPSDQQGSLLDNVSLAVPEPASWALMITGFGAAGVMLRRRRQAAVAA